MTDIKESDWKLLSREIKPLALDRLCERILQGIIKTASDPDQGAHARYLAVWKQIHKGNDDIALAFDGLCRSSAVFQLLAMRRLKLITDAEFSRFSDETRQFVERGLSI